MPSRLRSLATSLPATLIAMAPHGLWAASLQQILTTALRAAQVASNTPGVAATMTCGGRTIWSTSLGKSVTETGLPFQQSTLSSVASVTKMFTATITLRMAEDGLINLDSPIAPYVPSYIPGTHQVSIRNLVSMRSGYADIENLPAYIAAANDPNHRWSREELFLPITTPHFTPGSQEEYSNTNFLLLSAIIDHVYPGGVAAAFDAYIAAPAALGASVSFQRDPHLADRFAHGYYTVNGQTFDVASGARFLGVNTAVWGTIWGDGGIGATAHGLARFADALFGGDLVRPATLAAMEAPLATSDYGLGLERFHLSGRDWYGHVGAFEGYTAVIAHDIKRKVTFAAVDDAYNADTGAQNQMVIQTLAAFEAAGGCPIRP